MYVNVHMNSGETLNTWIDALSASFAGVQVIFGGMDREEVTLDRTSTTELCLSTTFQNYNVVRVL